MSSNPLQFTLRRGLWVTTTILPFSKGFQSRRGPYGSQDQAMPSDGTVEVIFAPEGRGTEPLTPAEIASVEWLIENATVISEGMIASLYAKYSGLKERREQLTDEDNEVGPKLDSGDDLHSLLGLHTIYIHQVEKDGIPYVGFEFGCDWETEHGLGVLMHGNRTVQIGYADTAFLRWIAEEDRDLPPKTKTRSPKSLSWPPVSREDGWVKKTGSPLCAPDEQEFYRVAGEQFSIVGPLVSRAEIEAVFPEPFPGREDLVEFYLRFNGGSRTPQGCVIHCGNPDHQVSRDQLGNLNVEGFRSISPGANERMLPFANLQMHHATMMRIYSQVPEAREFLENHLEIAFDHCGNDLCIDLQDGRLVFMSWESYTKGPVEVSPSFREFILSFWNVAHIQVD